MKSLFAAAIALQPLVSADVLEPSVRNEVDRAIARVPAAAYAAATNEQVGIAATLPFATNCLSVSDMAVRLVSMQRSDGRWMVGTNDFTVVAARILSGL
ncbi:MAG: hypothetical protein IIT98_03265 [Kiritimatiellae bacterium]|nr:hypothetical protein [Kiritimatiellia bacterium]